MKWRNWLITFGCITILQGCSMYFLNRFLQPPVLPVLAAAPTESNEPAPLVVAIPDTAVEPLMSPDQQRVAYIGAKQQLVVDGLNGTVFTKSVHQIPFKTWLDNSTLLFFEQTDDLSAYTLQLNGNQTILIHAWLGTKWKVIQTYSSPYMELLYIQLEDQSGYGHVYRYDAVTGIQELPIGSIHIRTIQYDPTKDILKVTDTANEVWSYQNNVLYQPNGQKVYIQAPQTPNSKGVGIQAPPSTPSTANHTPPSSNAPYGGK